MSSNFPPGARLGRYEIKSQRGAGGMGQVYLAEDTQLRRRVALKVLPEDVAANKDRMWRFIQEARAAAALNHPNIAHIYEIGTSPTVMEGSSTGEEAHFIAMEFIDGQTLRECIHGGQTDLTTLLRYLQHVAEGLAGDRELRRAIELSPSLAMARFYLGLSLVRRGRLNEGLAEFLKARELDPLSSTIARNVANPYYFKRDYVRALELLRQANELGPALSTTWEIGVYIQNGLFNEALAELEKAKRERKDDSILVYSTGMVYAAQGKRAEALRTI